MALMQFADNVGPYQRALLRSLGIFCSSTYTTVSTDSVSGEQAYALADQGLRCPQIT